MGVDRPAMEIDDSFTNRQPEPEPAILARDGSAALLKGIENPRQEVWFNPNPRIADLDDELVRRRVPGRNFDPSTLGRKLRRILYQVPKHLLQARVIRPAM